MINYLVSLILLVFTVQEMMMTDLPDCLVAQDFVILVHFGSHCGLLIVSALSGRSWGRTHEVFEHLSNISLMIILVAFPLNYSKTPECMSESFRWLLFWYFIPILLICILVLILIIGYLIYVGFTTLYQRHIASSVRKEIVKLLRMSLTDPTSLRDYYKRNVDKLLVTPLMEEELVVFKDNFENDRALLQDKYEISECLICYDGFETNVRATPYPGCNHIYHYQCLKEWFDRQKTTCPYCKNEFRIAFGEALCEKANTGVIRLSSVHERMLINYENRPAPPDIIPAEEGIPVELMANVGNQRDNPVPQPPQRDIPPRQAVA